MIRNFPSSLHWFHKKIILFLQAKGAEVEFLPNTEVVIVTIDDHEYYFIQDLLPVIPQNIVHILSDTKMTEDVLTSSFPVDISDFFSKQNILPSEGISVYYDRNGWLQIKSANSSGSELSPEYTNDIYRSVRPLAEKLLQVFLPTPYLCWDIISTNSDYKLKNISLSLNKFANGQTHKGNLVKSQLEATSQLFFKDV